MIREREETKGLLDSKTKPMSKMVALTETGKTKGRIGFGSVRQN